jgi:peptidoglycan-associated lipoprotein
LRTSWKLAVAAALVIPAGLAACASKPKPMPVAQAPAPAPQPPAPRRPAPTPPPVRSAPTPPPQSGPTPGSVQDFVINAGERVYFEYDSSDIRPDAQSILAAQATWLNRYPAVKVRVEGNADERGTRDYNFALGARRAAAVKTALVSHGVAGDRITTVSYGKERPIDPGSNEQAWAHNRNAHTDIVSGAR